MAGGPEVRPTRSLRGKFVRILLFVAVVMGISTIAIVATMNAQDSAAHLAQVEGHIQAGITSKGRVLTSNHALALRSMVQDNAFLDMQRLVERAVHDNADVAYGIFVNPEHSTLALSRHGEAGTNSDPPEAHAYQALGLDEGELLVKAPVVARVRRLGQDLLDVAVPVVSEDGEPLGTIRYGFSLEQMHEALAQAKVESRRRLYRSVELISAMVAGATVLGLLLSRRQAVRITEPVGALTRAAEDLAAGQRSVRVTIDSGDELERLGVSFNRMVEELDVSYQRLEQMNRTLEQKVEQRTAELRLKNRDMRLVLDNVDQGFATLTPAGALIGECSRALGDWFGAPAAGLPIWEYLASVSRPFAAALEVGWTQVADDILPLDVCLDQLPARLSGGTQTWSVHYLPFLHEGRLEGVLLVVADITAKLAREREDAEQQELMQSFKKLMLDRPGFVQFLHEGSEMVAAITAARADAELAAIRRTLHTLKGNAAVMGLTLVARLCHELEDELADEGRFSERGLAELSGRWTAVTEHVSKFVGAGALRVVEIPQTEYDTLVSRLARNERQSDVLHQVLTWQLEPATRSLQRLADQARALARRLGKGEVDVEVLGGSLRLDPSTFAPFFSELAHVVRNAVDHGFESPDARLAAGKLPRNKLLLKAELGSEELSFEVTDDGRGIDWARVAESAKDRGLAHATPADLAAALCTEGVTTREQATEVSGRGVGLAAFRSRIEAMSGRLEIRSTPGAGTSFFIRFPWPLEPPSRASTPVPVGRDARQN
jgi:chemotaxis protein histidine kinase CheA